MVWILFCWTVEMHILYPVLWFCMEKGRSHLLNNTVAKLKRENEEKLVFSLKLKSTDMKDILSIIVRKKNPIKTLTFPSNVTVERSHVRNKLCRMLTDMLQPWRLETTAGCLILNQRDFWEFRVEFIKPGIHLTRFLIRKHNDFSPHFYHFFF